jgi:hypothetical protein
MGKVIKPDITESEKKILDVIRSVDFGEINVIVQNNKPIRIERVTESIKIV